jgi:hypothetical protein
MTELTDRVDNSPLQINVAENSSCSHALAYHLPGMVAPYCPDCSKYVLPKTIRSNI